jgi:hypothetical protein
MRRSISFVPVVLAILGVGLGGCAPSSAEHERQLQLEEHPLAGAPELEPLTFRPLQGTQDEVLAAHADERAARISYEVVTVEGSPTLSSLGESRDLVAVLATSAEGRPEQTVTVLRDDVTIFEAPAGMPSPVLPLQGLWTFDGRWALEILFADETTWAGEVFIDGELVNAANGYDEAFGLQLLGGELFYFYRRGGHVGYSYDGNETDLAYDDIPHYRCCGESPLNPLQAEDMVAFFAVHEQTWFYVELGLFER